MRTVAVTTNVRDRRFVRMCMGSLVMRIGGIVSVRVTLLADAIVVMPERHA